MGPLFEWAIAASSDDEFDNLCDRAEVLVGIIAVKVSNKANKIETLQARLVTSYGNPPEKPTEPEVEFSR